MELEKVYKVLDTRIKQYENIIEELKQLGATESCIMAVIQDCHSVCNTRDCIRQEEYLGKLKR